MLKIVKEMNSSGTIDYYGVDEQEVDHLIRLPGHNGEPSNLHPFREKNKSNSDVFSCDFELCPSSYKDPMTVFSNWLDIPEFQPNRVPFLGIDY